MPRSFRAFLSARIRIRPESEDPADRCSHGVRNASPEPFPTFRRAGFPAPSFLRFKRLLSGRPDARRSKALPRMRVRNTLAGLPTLLRFLTKDLPSGSPDDSGVLSDGSERIRSTPCGADRFRRSDPPSEEGARACSEEHSR
jgi:hypothetical protein